MAIRTTHQLAAELLKCENVSVTVSVDISTCDEDAGRRAFGHTCMGVNDRRAPEITVLFEGEVNDA